MDLVSPIHLSEVKPQLETQDSHHRATQKSILANLPLNIRTQITLCLLDQPAPAERASCGKPPVSIATHLLDLKSISAFHSLTRTCHAFRHSQILSSNTWKDLLLDSVDRYRLSLLSRWRANPSGVGSATGLLEALDQTFVDVIKGALTMVQADLAGSDDIGSQRRQSEVKTVKDVYDWWLYDETWRSRRRIWYSVVHACATARDADWW